MAEFQFVVTVTEREPLQLDTNQAIQQVKEQLLEDSVFDPDTIRVELLSDYMDKNVDCKYCMRPHAGECDDPEIADAANNHGQGCTLIIDDQTCLQRGWDSDEAICIPCANKLRTMRGD